MGSCIDSSGPVSTAKQSQASIAVDIAGEPGQLGLLASASA